MLALLTSVLAVPVVAEEGTADLAVMNGEPASIDDLPWVVYLQHPGDGEGSSCKGSVISPSWILTAPHCVEYEDANGTYQRVQPGDVEVFFGMEEFDVGAKGSSRGSRIEIHPEWFSSGRVSSDIALIGLDQPTDTPPVQLVGADYVEVPGEWAVVSGWGLLEEDVETDRLMRGEVPILEDNIGGGLERSSARRVGS